MTSPGIASAAWPNFGVLQYQIFPYKPIFLESYILSPIYKQQQQLQQQQQQNASWECLFIRKPFGFVPQTIGFIQPAYYASIVNKANFRNIGKQTVHRFDF